jgi:hypothetical protein
VKNILVFMLHPPLKSSEPKCKPQQRNQYPNRKASRARDAPEANKPRDMATKESLVFMLGSPQELKTGKKGSSIKRD